MSRPTARFFSFAAAALLLYLFANQTQVGWLYVMSALLSGVLLVSYLLNRRSVRGVLGKRSIAGDDLDHEFYEDEVINISLILRCTKAMPLFQLQIIETCPFAPLEEQEHRIFVPMLPVRSEAAFDYRVTLDRRGVYQFSPLQMTSRAPFGYFQRRTTLDVPTRVLVYPVVRSLERFSLFDKQLAAQMVYPRAGLGSEVIGTRPYRPGDSPRHIHWRSVARTGELISKDFAEETRPGLTIVFDRHFTQPNSSKHTAFEWAVKCAVSIAEYAHKRGYPFYLLADEEGLAPPSGALAWDALLQYMARVNPSQKSKLPELLSSHSRLQNFVAVIVPQPDNNAVEGLIALKQRGYQVMPVLLDGASFPDGSASAAPFVDALRAAGLEAEMMQFGSDWAMQLAHSDRAKSYVETQPS